jgi:transposase InsO family protein
LYRGGNGNQITEEVKQLIKMMKQENPLWGAPRIYGELRKLGYEISIRSVQKYLPRRRTPPTPGWRAFLYNHIHETVGMDMFIAVSATFRLLYGFVLIEHQRRRIVHLAVTEHPTADGVTRQARIAFRRKRPRYILRDRDALYRPQFQSCIKAMGIKERIIDRQSPWQNAYAEAFIHTLRRECLSQIIPISVCHLQRILDSYVRYYNKTRCHSGLDYDSPEHRPYDPPAKGRRIVSIPEVGGLHHRYERRAA